MKEKTIFPREERSDMLFQKILNDSWACEKLQETFCQHLFCNDDHETPLSPKEIIQFLQQPGSVCLSYGNLSEYPV